MPFGSVQIISRRDSQSKFQILIILRSLSTRVFETRTATGREHFDCQEGIFTRISILLVSNGEKIRECGCVRAS